MGSTTHTVIIICGPTGIGKTSLAIKLARKLECDIISADSRQIYKEMSIGTAVPSEEELRQVKHHFVQTHSIHNYYNASMFENEVFKFLQDYFQKKNRILMVGGSGLYIDAVCRGIDDLPSINPAVRSKWRELYEKKGLVYLQNKVEGYDPDYYRTADLRNHKRLLKALEVYDQTGIPYSSYLKNSPKKRDFRIIKIGLNTNRKILYEQINNRVDVMMKAGFIDEARDLYPYRKLTPLNTVGYKELFLYFDGSLSMEDAIDQIRNHSRAYARRQITWFRRDPEIKWFEPSAMAEISKWIDNQMKKI